MTNSLQKNIAENLPYAYFVCDWKDNAGIITAAGGATLIKLKKAKGIDFFETIHEVFPKIPWKPIAEKLNVGKDAYYTEKVAENWYFIKITKITETELSVICLDFPHLYMLHFIRNMVVNNVKNLYQNYPRPAIFINDQNKVIYHNKLIQKAHIQFLNKLQQNNKWQKIHNRIRQGQYYVLKNSENETVCAFYPALFEEDYLGSLIVFENTQVSAKKLVYRLEEFSQNLHNNLLPDEEIFQTYFRDYFILSNRFAPYGSFYWFTQQFDNFILVFTDTEQYDIRGAYWSFLIHSLLNNIVNEKLAIYPKEIIEELTKNLHKFWTGYKETEEEASEEFTSVKIAALSMPNKFTHFRFCSKGIGMLLVRNKEIKEFAGDDLYINTEETEGLCNDEKYELPEKSVLLVFRKDIFEQNNLYKDFKKIIEECRDERPLHELKEKIKTFCLENELWYNTNIQIVAIKV